MKVVERSVVAKSGDPDTCEDALVVTDDYAAVIDGATDKTKARYEGRLGGRFAMEVCAETIADFPPDLEAAQAIKTLTDALAARLPGQLPPAQRPTAVVGIYSAARRELWRLGDVGFWHEGLAEGGDRPQKLVDHHAAGLRAAVLTAELRAGRTVEALRDDDCGRDAIMPLLLRQGVFTNSPEPDEWGHGAIDGTPVPGHYIEVRPVPESVHTLVLATDGYPRILPTLTESEQHLQKALAQDPLCIGPLRGTKGLAAGALSFDDRAYLRLAL